jgi:3-hydroxybutyryl-CoA dehydrogenase
VDQVMREGAGFRMGPFELLDLTGLDVSFKVMTQIYHQFFEEPRFRPQPLAARQYVAGLFGRKVGQGFYVYKDGKPVLPKDASPQQHDPRPVWLDTSSGQYADRVLKRLSDLGLAVAVGDKPDPGSIILVAPVGGDATSAAVEGQYDPERTLAIDPLFGLESRITVMTTAVTDRQYRDSLCAMLTKAGAGVTAIHDSPGFIAQRMVATIVNIACDIAQQRISSPADIDLGARLGLGYPTGPLALGDRIGPRTILQILESMYSFYGDPRYRPSPWLKRRALLGRALTTEEA